MIGLHLPIQGINVFAFLHSVLEQVGSQFLKGPHLAFRRVYLVYTVGEDIKMGPGRNRLGAALINRVGKPADEKIVCHQADKIPFPGNEKGRRVSTAGKVQFTGAAIVDAIPDGEIKIVVLFHLECFVKCRQHAFRNPEVGVRQCLGSDGVERRNRQKGRADPVPADIEKIHGKGIFIKPVITETVPA